MSDCGTQNSSFTYSGDYYYYYSSYFSSTKVCVYKLDTSTSSIDKYSIIVYNLENAYLYVYTEPYSGQFTSKGSISDGGSKSISIGYYEDVYVVVKPYSNNAYVYFYAEGQYSYTPYSYDTGLGVGAIMGITLGSVFGFAFLTALII